MQNAECHYAECHYTECHYAECKMLSVIVLKVVSPAEAVAEAAWPSTPTCFFLLIFDKNEKCLFGSKCERNCVKTKTLNFYSLP